ncbi:MAG: hypothetical protein ACE5HO_21770 [bacterium]
MNPFKRLMEKADYSIATPEEREEVIAILQRNANHIIEQKKTRNPDKLRQAVDALSARIRKGEIITGKDFQKLVRILQKKTVGD